MKTNLVKMISILLMAFALVAAFSSPVFANSDKSMLTGNSGFNIQFKVNDRSNSSETIANFVGNIIYICQIVGISVATIMLIVLAIKYIAASPNDKAEIKKHLIVYVVGCVLLFGASGILALIRKFITGNFNQDEITEK